MSQLVKYHYEYIPVARESLEKPSKLYAFEFTWINKPQVFEDNLSQYTVVVFLNTPGEELNEAQRKKLEDYMRAGGNAVVVYKDPQYLNYLLGGIYWAATGKGIQ